MMSPEAAIFDMDGLLLDSERPVREAWFTVCRQRGLELNDTVYLEAVGRNESDTQKLFRQHLGEDFPYHGIRSQVEEILVSQTGALGFALKAGVVEMLEFFASRSVPCAVATSTARLRASDRLARAGILSYFTHVSGGDEVARGKPEPDLFLLAAGKLAISPANCLAFEDSAFGARAAKSAGMQVIVVPDLKPPPEDVRNFARGVFPSLTLAMPSVREWLNGL